MIRKPRFNVDAKEWGEIGISILCISLALTLSSAGIAVKPGQFAFLMAVYAITVGSGFLLHELSHKYFAVKYGAYARYQTWTFGLAMMLGLAIIPQIFGFHLPLFLAPGAVMIYAAAISPKQNGIISAAGPMANIVLAMLFFASGIIFFGAYSFAGVGEGDGMLSIWSTVVVLGIQVNFFLAMFNLLPFPPLDGFKIMMWDWRIWGAMFAIAFLGSGLITF